MATHEGIKFRKVLYIHQSHPLCLILNYLCIKSVLVSGAIVRYHHKNKQRKEVGNIYRKTCEKWGGIPSQKVNNLYHHEFSQYKYPVSSVIMLKLCKDMFNLKVRIKIEDITPFQLKVLNVSNILFNNLYFEYVCKFLIPFIVLCGLCCFGVQMCY